MLPDEIWLHVIQWGAFKSIINIALTCKRLAYIISTNNMIIATSFAIAIEHNSDIIHRLPNGITHGPYIMVCKNKYQNCILHSHHRFGKIHGLHTWTGTTSNGGKLAQYKIYNNGTIVNGIILEYSETQISILKLFVYKTLLYCTISLEMNAIVKICMFDSVSSVILPPNDRPVNIDPLTVHSWFVARDC
jgi:hypothetical protein